MRLEVKKHFQFQDPVLFKWFEKVGEIRDLEPKSVEKYFGSLCREIIYQQLSGKVAKVISERFQNLFPNKKVSPSEFINISHEDFRACGLSNSKANYVRNIAEAVLSGDLDFSEFPNLDSEEISEKLTKIKGIGPWTVEMFLVFTMGREDIFSFGDLGLKKGIQKVYELKDLPTKSEMEELSGRWKPYRTYASFVLWKSLEIN